MLASVLVAACTRPPFERFPEAPDVRPEPAPRAEPQGATGIQQGRISLYGHAFAGRKTASGAAFDPEAMTMAHRTLPFGTRVRITNLGNRRSVEVTVTDRGPFVAGRIADVSLAAARALGMVSDGVVDAMLEILAPATRQ